MIIFWILVLLFAVIVELLTIQLVSVPFMFGAVIALITAYLGVGKVGQIVFFTVTSVVALILFQIFVKRSIAPHRTPTNLDALIGREIVVVYFENGKGIGNVNGVQWKIVSDEPLLKDELVHIKKIKGTTMVVGKE